MLRGMFLLKDEAALRQAFRPRDREPLELPAELRFPLFVRDYLAWVEPAGSRVFLVFCGPGEKVPTGIAFRRDARGERGAQGHLCEWCHAQGSGDEIGLLTTDVSSRRRVGTSLCLDLRCGQRLEEAADLRGRNGREAAKALLGRMSRFAQGALGITQENR
jgi:hypothetical protein